MKTSTAIGRLGGLAFALGVGTAVVAGSAIAAADSGSNDSSAGSSSSDGPARSRLTVGTPGSVANPISRGSDRRAARTAVGAAAAGPTGIRAGDLHGQSRDPRDRLMPAERSRPLAGLADGLAASVASPAAVKNGPSRAVAAVRSALSAASTAPRPPGLASAMLTSPSAMLTSSVNPDAMRPRFAPNEIWVAVGSALLGLTQSGFRELSIAGYLGPTESTLNQTLVVNGYNFVPNSTEIVTAAYGQWTFWPGGPTLIQGQQQYSVVDPATNQSVGTFDALVSTGSPLNVRSKYVELVVTANDGINVGTGAGQIPPVGSVIGNFDLLAGFGWSYSAMPAEPETVVTFKFVTPFGDIPRPSFTFDASKGVADRTVDNQPVNLGNGYTIAPTDPATEIYFGTSGFLPYYNAIQAFDSFDVRDSLGNTVGSFEGLVTPTADLAGVNTQAILVTKVTGGTIGTLPGDVPPVGSVFNVMYRQSPTSYVVYSSMPSTSGDVVSVLAIDGDKVTNIATFPLNLLNASALPLVKRLPIAKGYSYLPTSELTPGGVNGLPPREIQVQGYQQFGVYDAAGVLQGTFDADVAIQVDMFGIRSQALLVTKVTGGTEGTALGEVPPAGSIINYLYFGDSGFGTYYTSMPSPSGAKTTFKFLTPLIDIPTWSTYNASAGLTDVTLWDPFAP